MFEPPSPVHSPRLKDLAYELIKERVLQGTFPPNSFLSERKLALELDMSKTPVRSAIERLEYEGYLTISPNHGVVVRELSIGEIGNHFDIRTALETHTVRKLAGRLQDEQVTALEENLHAQAEALEANDGLHSAKLDVDYHLLLCRLAGNEETYRVMKHELEMLYRIVVQLSTRNRRKASYEEHNTLTRAIIDGEADGAVSMIQSHLNFGRHFWGHSGCDLPPAKTALLH